MRSLFLLDDQAALLNKNEKILYFLILAFLLTLYPPDIPVVNNIVVAGIALFSFFYNSFRDKRSLLRRRKEIVLMVAFFLQHIISSLASNDRAEGFSWVVLRLPLLVFPVTIGLMFIGQALKERIMYAFVFVTALTMVFCIIWSVIQYRINDEPGLLYNDSLTSVIGKQSSYVAMLVNLAVFGLGYLVSVRSALVTRRLFVYLAAFVLLLANFLLASRIGIIILYSSILVFAMYYAIRARKIVPLVGVALGIGIAWLLLVNFFPKTINRFRELEYTGYEYSHQGVESHYNMDVTADQWNGANIRLAIWSCGWELFKQHPLLGVQLGDKVDRLMAVYAAKKFDFGYKTRRNMHNTYLDVMVAFGIVGLLLFLNGFILIPFAKAVKTKDFWGCMVIIAFALSMITETYIDRSFGCMMFGFFVSLIVSYRKPATNSN